MKIKKLILENFRGYKAKTEFSFERDITTIIGENDVGKSTILEAMDIFFNDGQANNKISKDDISKGQERSKVRIGLVFTDLPGEVVVDAQFPTTLQDEFLLNQDGDLEVHKFYGASGLAEVKLICQHPKNEKLKDLLSLVIEKLKEKAEGLSGFDARISSSIRQAIRKSEDIGELETIELSVYKKDKEEKTGAKEIWDKLQNYLPIYALFQSDRKNQEKDSEVQDPMKVAIKQILEKEEIKAKLKEVKDEVEKIANQVASLTIEKLNEMNPLVAKTLIPKFTEPKWTSAFDFSIASDEDISMNKRGSGVRRLILLNFFRAEVERKKKEKNAGTVIYAFEEPETSQHPNHQKKLIEAFIELGKESDVQVILTTHSPEIAKILPEDSLRLIQKNGKSISIHDTNTDDEILEKIATTLGVLPSIEIEDINKVKIVVCLEGYKDIDFLEGVNSAIQQFKDLVDIKNDSRVICIPLGGSTLEFWVNRRYLSKLNLTEIHIYDSDLSSKDPKNIKKIRKTYKES